MKKYLLTGLAIILPLALTLVIIAFLVNLLTDPFVGLFKPIFAHYHLLDQGILFISASHVQRIISQVLIIALLFFSTAAIGFVARWLFINYLIRLWDETMAKIPLIRTVYKICQEAIQTLFNPSNKSFKEVVMVPFPTQETLAIGFVTQKQVNYPESSKKYVSVFVPTTPNPTSGFLIMYEASDLIPIDMKADDALSHIISCGLIPMKSSKPDNTKRL